jgi:long-subunit fatty acid transport protein
LGVLAGQVRSAPDILPIDGATVVTDLNTQCRSIQGEYMMVVPASVLNAYAEAEHFERATAENLAVVGSDVTWRDFDLLPAEDVGPAIDSPEYTPGTSRTDDTDGGSYCFIGLLQTSVPMKSMGLALGYIAALIAAAGCRSSMVILLLCLILLLHPAFPLFSPAAYGATIFQDVGIASPPVPVGSGARALGMGGAFIATADDATAASWNPAGLIQLEKPELSIVGAYELRSLDITSASHPESNTQADDGYGSLNYVSATLPVHWFKNLVFSVNYQRLYDFERSLDYRFDYPQSANNAKEQRHYRQSGKLGAVGLAGAAELTPRLSIGATLNIWTDELGWENGWREQYTSTLTAEVSGTPQTIHTTMSDAYEQFRGINANLGILWETRTWGRFGAVIRTPFTATMVHRFRFAQITITPTSTEQSDPYTLDETVELEMPLSYGAGWSRRFFDQLTIGLDLSRTHWDNYILTDAQGNEFSPIDGRPASRSRVDPTTHIRLGAEYVFLWPQHQAAIPLRGGLFYDPEPGQDQSRDYYGCTLGGGITRKKFSFDAACQLRWAQNADTNNLIVDSTADAYQHTLLASLIYYF